MAAAKPKHLYRSEKDRMIAGVCGGLAIYFNMDASLVRVLWILITLLGGSGILIYIILWIVLPTESNAKIQ
ncbi:PspC domain-containing protein [Candidatus Roizmanbacteria bacterium]|nr:PspC domain-containing protein [Candidatus Roizmanbacteria bacterium]